MKKILILFVLMNCFQEIYAQIADLKVESGVVKIINEKGQLKSSISSSGKKILGYTGTFWVWTANGVFYTFDENCKEISRKTLTNLTFKSIGGNSITFTGNGVTYIFDKNFIRTN